MVYSSVATPTSSNKLFSILLSRVYTVLLGVLIICVCRIIIKHDECE